MEDKDFFSELQQQKFNSIDNKVELSTLQNFMKEWEPYSGTCPHCNSTNIEYQTGIMLTSNPPQYRLRCKDCGKYFFSGQIEYKDSSSNSLNEYFKHDQSILNTPKIQDPTPSESPWVPFNPDPFRLDPPTKNNYGWICPKCGKVLAPHLDSCKYCSSNSTTTTNIIKVPLTFTGEIEQAELDKLKKCLETSPAIINDCNSITTTPDTPTYTISNNAVDKEAMKQKFLNESESVFEAVNKYKEWEKENIK